MAEPRCEISDLPVSMCAHCLGQTLGDEPDHTKPEVVSTWEARYHGVCSACSASIKPGEPMGRTKDEAYVCQGCL